MENTIVNEVAKNNEVAPVIKQAAKHSVNGGAVALAVTAVAVAGYVIWKGAEKLKEAHDTKKEEKDAAAKTHDFCVEGNV
jgi:hypothetical protein